jgi:hypothetical protein
MNFEQRLLLRQLQGQARRKKAARSAAAAADASNEATASQTPDERKNEPADSPGPIALISPPPVSVAPRRRTLAESGIVGRAGTAAQDAPSFALTPPPAPPGWCGLEEMTIGVDGQLCVDLAAGGLWPTRVIVARGSPAYAAGMRSGDYLLSISPSPIERLSLGQLKALGLPPGTEVFAKFCRPGRGKAHDITTTVLRLRAQPKPKDPPVWKRKPKTACGESVGRSGQERHRYDRMIREHPLVSALGYRLLAHLLKEYHGPNGAFPSYGRLACEVHCTKRGAIKQLVLLNWLGLVEVIKRGGSGAGRADRRTNRYRICWPLGYGENVVSLWKSQTNEVNRVHQRGEPDDPNEVNQTTPEPYE